VVVINSGDDAIDDVVNVSVVAARRAVAEDRDWFARAD
jgi:hypothetical protein